MLVSVYVHEKKWSSRVNPSWRVTLVETQVDLARRVEISHVNSPRKTNPGFHFQSNISMFVFFLSLFLYYNAPPFCQAGFCRFLVTFIAPIFKFSLVEKLTRVCLMVNQMLVQTGNPGSCKG